MTDRTPQPSEQPRTAYPSMRYRLAAALHMAANLPEYNLSHRMMSVHGGPGDMSYLDAADMILGTQPMLDYAYEAAAPDPVAPLDAVKLADALEAEGFVRGVAARYGTFNRPYWEQSAAAILKRLEGATDGND